MNAVFAVVIGNLLVAYPGAVIPIFVEIPLAIAIGQYIYRTRSAALVPSLIGVAALYFLIWVGNLYPIEITGLADALGFERTRDLWVIILFVYAFIASRLPVWLLLQPRDYINSHQLFIAIAVIFAGVLVGMDRIVAPMFNDVPAGSPSIFPFLFITVACGAISGFHSLVASGTTSKQLDKETDARYVGYAGAIGEEASPSGRSSRSRPGSPPRGPSGRGCTPVTPKRPAAPPVTSSTASPASPPTSASSSSSRPSSRRWW
ncbi:hypothetical protein GCM10029963_49620 [Micromonospora andamanensis]